MTAKQRADAEAAWVEADLSSMAPPDAKGAATAPPPLPPVGSEAEPVPMPKALEGVLLRLFADAPPRRDGPPVSLAFEPLAETGSALQTHATVLADRLAPSIVRNRLGRQASVGSEPNALERAQWIVAGGLRLEAAARDADGRLRALPLCLALIDRSTGRVLSRRNGWVDAAGLDLVPTAFYLDLPFVMHRPQALEADVLCRDDPAEIVNVAQDHLLQLPSVGQLDLAITLYNRAAWQPAAAAFRQLAEQGGPSALLPLAGLYLATARLDQPGDAEQALRQLVQMALPLGPLALNLVQPSVAPSDDDPALARREALRMYARLVANWEACVVLVGQHGVGGNAGVQKQAALRRAESVRRLLVEQGQMRPARVFARGAEPPRPLVGLGTDDPRDAWDRRVEMNLQSCKR